jgi:hypothetical protein
MEIPQGNTLENSGKQNPKMGFKSPLAFKYLLLKNLRFRTAIPFSPTFSRWMTHALLFNRSCTRWFQTANSGLLAVVGLYLEMHAFEVGS